MSDRPMAAPVPVDGATPGQRPTPLWALAALGVAGCTTLAAVCWISGHVQADPLLQSVARFLHVAALVVGLGAVLAVDWFAVLWLLGRRRLADVLNTANSLQLPIWLGLAGLFVTGLFLHPDLAAPLTQIKLGLVLAITLNGLYAHWLGQRFDQHKDTQVPRHLLIQSGAATTISQLCWWGASLIGYVNSQS